MRGKKYGLWWALERGGFVLDMLVQNRRNTKATERLIKIPSEAAVSNAWDIVPEPPDTAGATTLFFQARQQTRSSGW